MIKILTIIGARPQIIKAAALSRAINNEYSNQIEEYILHTGQHYDENMSEVFFKELNIPRPNFNLNVGSGNHGSQTAKMITQIEEILLELKPQYIVLYGDTNSTLAGAIAASKIEIPIIHIEAGLRSFNKKMPEEINRIVCDHVSTLLFAPTSIGVENLKNENFNLENRPPYNIDNPKVYHCGDIMFDNSIYFLDIANKNSNILEKHKLEINKFILCTIHRNHNTDDFERLNSIFKALSDIQNSSDLKIILPLHPRTKKMLKTNIEKQLFKKIFSNNNFIICEPVSFLDMIKLESNAKLIITDSGGVQKESYFFKKPCIILRPQTEWIEIVEVGNAIIADANYNKILNAFENLNNKKDYQYPEIYGNGKASEFICEKIIENSKFHNKIRPLQKSKK